MIFFVLVPQKKYSKDISFFKNEIFVPSQINFGDSYEDVLKTIKADGYKNMVKNIDIYGGQMRQVITVNTGLKMRNWILLACEILLLTMQIDIRYY